MYLEESIYIIDFYHSKIFEGPNFLFRPRSMKPQDQPWSSALGSHALSAGPASAVLNLLLMM
jgi:hypothetical protein